MRLFQEAERPGGSDVVLTLSCSLSLSLSILENNTGLNKLASSGVDALAQPCIFFKKKHLKQTLITCDH